jgi:hypothetical protein
LPGTSLRCGGPQNRPSLAQEAKPSLKRRGSRVWGAVERTLFSAAYSQIPRLMRIESGDSPGADNKTRILPSLSTEPTTRRRLSEEFAVPDQWYGKVSPWVAFIVVVDELHIRTTPSQYRAICIFMRSRPTGAHANVEALAGLQGAPRRISGSYLGICNIVYNFNSQAKSPDSRI